ncbi:MAG: FKBP-type peptidyl-prolyl cis-trans isomerase [Cardiobacteriaceae bacterium]|nr:FKBP-type peptidyl-prolyl cis-trans isomerase [Cardiobacteriaceae bacterium]
MTYSKILLTAAIAAAIGSAHAIELKNDADKVGYAIGVDMGSSVKDIGGKNINIESMIAGLKDAFEGKELSMSREDMDNTMRTFAEARMKEMQAQFEKEVTANAAEGKKFLDENGKKDGVKTTKTGLQYKVEQEGKGAKPTDKDKVTVNYEGRLIDGTVFDSSYERKEPVTFNVTDVIPGWVEGLQLMSEGSKYTFYIPANLAYGEAGAPPNIPPNATLIFNVELVKVGAEAANKPTEDKKAEEKPAEAAKASK